MYIFTTDCGCCRKFWCPSYDGRLKRLTTDTGGSKTEDNTRGCAWTWLTFVVPYFERNLPAIGSQNFGCCNVRHLHAFVVGNLLFFV